MVQLDAQGVYKIGEAGEVRRAEHGVGFQAASVNQQAEEIRERCKTKKQKLQRERDHA